MCLVSVIAHQCLSITQLPTQTAKLQYITEKKMNKKKKDNGPAHSEFSASGSSRWLNCPGSIALSRNAPEQHESEYATEGTEAHYCLEVLLTHHAKGQIRQAKDFLLKTYPEEMVEHGEQAARDIFAQVKTDGTLLCETRVDLSFVAPKLFGTVDAAIIREFDRLTIIDYKYGAGIPVEPEFNSQQLYYALGIAHLYDYNFSEIELQIIQPRAEHYLGDTRSWVTSVDTLFEYREKFAQGYRAAHEPNAPLKSGNHCRFCPAAVICPELSTRALEQAQIDFTPGDNAKQLVVPDPSLVPIEKLGNLVDACSQLEVWIKKVKEHALGELKLGRDVPGYKLVEKTPRRKWVNESAVMREAAGQYGDNALVTKVLSPAQMEKKLKNFTWVEKRISRESSGLTMVTEQDKRQAINPFADFLD